MVQTETLSQPLRTLLGLVGIVSLLNINQKVVLANEQAFLEVSPEKVLTVTQAIAPYTSTIDEQTESVTGIVSAQPIGTLKKPEVTETIVSPRAYTVQQGDTISRIAEKTGLTVATILEANNLGGSDTTNLQVGQQLTIPPENTSTSLAWLEEEQKVRLAREAKARAEVSKRLALASRRVAGRSSTREVADGGFEGEASGDFITPVRYKYKGRCGLKSHPGADLPADYGTPVVAADSGRVVETTGGYGRGWGLSVVIDHGGGLKSRYAHLSKIRVSAGDEVVQGEIIGDVGNTGFSFGSHLHFDKIINGNNVRFCP